MTETLTRVIGRTSRTMHAVGAQDLDLLQRGGQRGGDLHHPRVEVAGKGVDLAQGFDLDRKGGAGDRVGVGIEPPVGAAAARRPRCRRRRPRPAARFPRRASAPHSLIIGRMGIARDLAPHRAQAEAFGGIDNWPSCSRPSSKTSASDWRRSRNSSPSSAPSVAVAQDIAAPHPVVKGSSNGRNGSSDMWRSSQVIKIGKSVRLTQAESLYLLRRI